MTETDAKSLAYLLKKFGIRVEFDPYISERVKYVTANAEDLLRVLREREQSSLPAVSASAP